MSEKKTDQKYKEKIVRILQKDIEGKMTIYSGLTKIKGVSWSLSNASCRKLNIDKRKKCGQGKKSEIKEIVRNADLLDEQIKTMLNITEQLIEESFDIKSEALINSIFETIEWNQQTDEDNNLINSISFNNAQKMRIEGLVNTLTTDAYKNRIEQFIDNTNKISEAENLEKKSSGTPSELIFELIKKNDSGEGVLTEEIISKSNVADAERIIKQLLEEGDIFEVRPGKLKVL